MDDNKLIESLHSLREKLKELSDAIDLYENTKRVTTLRTIRTLSSAVGHISKNFRAVSIAYEKNQKA